MQRCGSRAGRPNSEQNDTTRTPTCALYAVCEYETLSHPHHCCQITSNPGSTLGCGVGSTTVVCEIAVPRFLNSTADSTAKFQYAIGRSAHYWRALCPFLHAARAEPRDRPISKLYSSKPCMMQQKQQNLSHGGDGRTGRLPAGWRCAPPGACAMASVPMRARSAANVKRASVEVCDRVM